MPGHGCAHPAQKHLVLWLHLAVHSQALGLNLIGLLRIQYFLLPDPRPGTQQGPSRWQPGYLLVTRFGSLPHWGLVGGKHSVNTCKGLLSPPTPQGRIRLPWAAQAWGEGRGSDCVGGSLKEIAFLAEMIHGPSGPANSRGKLPPHHPSSLRRAVSSSREGDVARRPGRLSSLRAPRPPSRLLGDFTN